MIMALHRKDSLSQISAGWLRGRYFLRDLLGQTLILFAVIASAIGYALYQWYQTIPADDLNYLMLYFKGFFWAEVIQLRDHIVVFQHSEGLVKLEAAQILANSDLVSFKEQYFQLLIDQVKSTLPWAAGAWGLLAVLFFWSGKIQKDNEFLEGVRQVPLSVYHRFLKSHRIKSPIKLGNAHWVKDAEVQHLLAMGDPGTGKSKLLNQLLASIRSKGDLAIVYDPKGDMVRDFYQAEHDVLYSPFDTRSPQWDIWQDLNTEQALEAFAEALIQKLPDNKDKFWVNNARLALVSGLKQGRIKGKSFQETLDILMNSEIEELKAFYSGTEFSSTLSNPKSSTDILSELKSQARMLKYISRTNPENTETAFSIGEFMSCFLDRQDKTTQDHGWLFLPVNERFKATATTIMAAQIELIANYILSQPTDRDRRVWFIVDELPSLPKLPALMRLLAQGRGYGVAGVLAIQNISQLFEVYGRDGAYSLAGLCSSLVAMRSSDTQTMEYLSKRFGKQIRKEVQTNQSLSKGKMGSMSEGHSEHIAERAAVSETDINTLPDLKAFFKAKGVPNPVKIDIAITEMPALNPPHCLIDEQIIEVEVIEAPEDNTSQTDFKSEPKSNASTPLQTWEI
jgi:DNA polymerase III delta prime subunit